MDSTLTYKCPNCNAGLIFDAEKQLFHCEFCMSDFTEDDLLETGAAEAEARNRKMDEEFSESVDEYYCPSCGAEVIADKNTAADFCYYCHNPIVLSNKMTGAMRPSKIIPFKLSKDEAKEHFLSFAKSKKFVPKGYFSGEHIEKMSGVYYPFWVTDADTDSAMKAIGKKIRTWRVGDTRYTEVNRYAIYRQGRIHFEDITTSAISTDDKAMLEGVLPYPVDAYKDFSMPYLQGFVAKKRDIDRESLSGEVKQKMNKYAEDVFRRTITGYQDVDTTSMDVAILNAHWEYSLMPIWILNYKKKDKNFVYAMNGATGKVYGELPVSIPKLLLLFGGVFLAALALFFGIGLAFF